ncbi:hypothetical protein V497_02873, partial [Pseudogymnoascus sp. VKM F-4516 (FW-969)]
MDSSPPLDNQDWPTPSRRTSRVLKRYANFSERQIAAATGIPKSTVHDHLTLPTSRTYRPRGRKTKIDSDTIEKMITSLQGHYNERSKPWSKLREQWKLDCTDQTLANAFARHSYYKCKACQKG